MSNCCGARRLVAWLAARSDIWTLRDRLAASQAEINNIVTDALQFISGLQFTLNQGLPQEKLCALRQCVERILIDKPARSVIVKIKAVPASTIQEVEQLACELGPADAVAAQ